MKKIFIILIMVFCLSLSACRYTDEGNYEFIKKEDVENALSVYYANVTLKNGDGTEETFTLVENENYFYYNYKQNYYLVDKTNELLYSIKHNDKLKLLELKLEFDYIANKNVLVNLLAEHISVVNKEYQMSKKSTNINGFDCYEYVKTVKADANNYIKRAYFVDEKTGYCIKGETLVSTKGNESFSSWYVNELKFDHEYANGYLDNINNYQEGVAQIEFDAWPDMGLGKLLPECTNGTFMFAVDYGQKATISIEQINSVDVKNYAASLVNYGFKEGKSSTNETNQFLYVTYNDDNILVKIIYTQSLMNLTIRISESSKEEIDSELGKL